MYSRNANYFHCFIVCIPAPDAMLIHSQLPLSLASENIRKPYGFILFSGVEKGCIGNKMVNLVMLDFGYICDKPPIVCYATY